MSVSDKIVISASGFGLFSWATNKLYGNLTDVVYNKYATVYEPAGIVSIIIPAFNEEDYIETCLKSILSQNIIQKYKDYFECIVVDNESTDRTAKIARQYCQVTSAPRGLLNARDAGIRAAVGDIIVLCDADTYYPPNWLNLILRHFHNHEVIGVHGSVLYSKATLSMRIASVWAVYLLPHLKRAFAGANSAFRKGVYLKMGGFDFSIDQTDRVEVAREVEIRFGDYLRQMGKVVFDINAACFTSSRWHGSTVLAETERTLTSYQEQRKRGERF